MAGLWVSLARRRRRFAVAALLLVLGLVAFRVHPALVGKGAPAWALWVPRVGAVGVPLGAVLAAALFGAAMLEAFEEPRHSR